MTLRCAIFGVVAIVLASGASAVEVLGFEPWKLGMTREEVLAVSSSGPYSPVPSTGGLETRNAQFQGKKVTASFVFASERLTHIQIWAYEGTDYKDALRAFHGAYSYLSENVGSLQSGNSKIPAGLDLQALDQLIPSEFRTGTSKSELGELQQKGSIQAQFHKFHLHPQEPPAGAEVYASLIHSPQVGSYWVFVYFKTPAAGL